MVGASRDALAESFAALTALDSLAARVSFARRHRAVCPRLDEGFVRPYQGSAAAMSFITAAIMIAFSYVNNLILRKRGEA